MEPQTLEQLVIVLRKNTAKMSAQEALDFLKSQIDDTIYVRCENLPPSEAAKFRVILTSNRNKANFNKPLVAECNGVVLEYPTWDVLSVPPKMFNPKFRLNDVLSGEHIVYEINDGTTVTLYWYNNKWNISSTNGYDVSGYKWLGKRDYMEALLDVSAAYNFSFDKLDRNCCYTIGFRHHDFHPLLTDPQKMWLIQTCDVSKMNSESPKLTMVDGSSTGIPMQTAVDIDMATMQKNNAEALNKYINSYRKTPIIDYGYIIRSKSGSDVVLESTLLKNIRLTMYHIPKLRHCNSELTPLERLEYNILRAYLGNDTKYLFANLFPQFSNYYRKYDDIFGRLSSRIIQLLRNKPIPGGKLLTNKTNVGNNSANNNNANNNSNSNGNSNNGINTPSDDKFNTLAVKLYEYISTVKINVQDPQSQSIINDFITNSCYMDMYYTFLIRG